MDMIVRKNVYAAAPDPAPDVEQPAHPYRTAAETAVFILGILWAYRIAIVAISPSNRQSVPTSGLSNESTQMSLTKIERLAQLQVQYDNFIGYLFHAQEPIASPRTAM